MFKTSHRLVCVCGFFFNSLTVSYLLFYEDNCYSLVRREKRGGQVIEPLTHWPSRHVLSTSCVPCFSRRGDRAVEQTYATCCQGACIPKECGMLNKYIQEKKWRRVLWCLWVWWWAARETMRHEPSSELLSVYTGETDALTNRYTCWLLGICRFNTYYFHYSWAVWRSAKYSNLSFCWAVHFLPL